MAIIVTYIYRVLTSVLVWPLSLFICRHQNFKNTIARRHGISLPKTPEGKKNIWIHAASVGEVKAVTVLVDRLKQMHQDLFVVLTSMTSTGREVARNSSCIDLVLPFPFDVYHVMKRYLDVYNPKLILIVETEIWPNLMLRARDMGIPVIFFNARMSESSYSRYIKFRRVMKEILKQAHVLSCASQDGKRFSDLGAQKVDVIGNVKLDYIVGAEAVNRGGMRRVLGISDRPVFIAGSVREGEERPVLDAIRHAASRIPGLFSIIAPRHLDRVDLICDMADEMGFRWRLRSEDIKDVDVLIIDKVGELFDLYGSSDAAFVGGSLIDLGGQNILEPIAWGVPVIHGPFMSNFAWAMDVVEGCTVIVHDSCELGDAIVDIYMHNDRYAEQAGRALEAVEGARGITEEYITAIGHYLGQDKD